MSVFLNDPSLGVKTTRFRILQLLNVSDLPAQVDGLLPRDLHSLGSWRTQQRQRGGAVCSDEQTPRYGSFRTDLLIQCALNGARTDSELGIVEVDGTTPTAVGPEPVTSVRSYPEMSTRLLHPHSPGRETALQVTHTLTENV